MAVALRASLQDQFTVQNVDVLEFPLTASAKGAAVVTFADKDDSTGRMQAAHMLTAAAQAKVALRIQAAQCPPSANDELTFGCPQISLYSGDLESSRHADHNNYRT